MYLQASEQLNIAGKFVLKSEIKSEITQVNCKLKILI